jgi:hypothetical protein
MEFVKDQPIAEYCDERKLTIEERLELFRQTFIFPPLLPEWKAVASAS